MEFSNHNSSLLPNFSRSIFLTRRHFSHGKYEAFRNRQLRQDGTLNNLDSHESNYGNVVHLHFITTESFSVFPHPRQDPVQPWERRDIWLPVHLPMTTRLFTFRIIYLPSRTINVLYIRVDQLNWKEGLYRVERRATSSTTEAKTEKSIQILGWGLTTNYVNLVHSTETWVWLKHNFKLKLELTLKFKFEL